MLTAVKITSKGQITIPKRIRDILDTDIVEFEVKDNLVVLKPVRSVGGSLSKYSVGRKTFSEIRDIAWDAAVNDKFKK
ncbi:MAG: AbrB/MazE/SpoVT family DNA-binding domain-containing protein [Nitrospirae bacterium]|nr:AbrB/MazE/SpoVT family DNA-binding domain-containing protein [Nitrospirota bacterium]MBF0533608.1 AbrB/MazE/SpoVT family DNA-binding domain-containing protein [Nitrospirota bacterium]MBF0616741.1 AbrB/MazE/SpoVT family DNA-binding domain-containing protein [Nitrospirota bacterium]